MSRKTISTQEKKERAVLVGVDLKKSAVGWSIDSSLEELGQLARTAGAMVVGRFSQKMEKTVSHALPRIRKTTGTERSSAGA